MCISSRARRKPFLLTLVLLLGVCLYLVSQVGSVEYGAAPVAIASVDGGAQSVHVFDSISYQSISYGPAFPEPGQYSIPNLCKSIHSEDAIVVTIQDDEPLQEAYDRLRRKSANRGGVLAIPWDAKLRQCDSMRALRGKAVEKLTVRGLVGPDGQLPHFYCRRVERQGTVAKQEVAETLIRIGSTITVVENLHIDGYQSSLKLPSSGHVVIRNNYMHHALSNGLVYSDTKHPSSLKLEICGNEISHSGRGNAEHGLYLHRNLSGEAIAEVFFVDNLCHSTPYSSCYKSIANKNFIVNNRFYQSFDTDPSFTKHHSSMLVDVAACAINHIEGNVFVGHKASESTHGDILIGVRNRKSIKGCDSPPYDSKEFWSESYWRSLKGEVIFPTVIYKNKFVAGPDYGHLLFAITAFGTFPNEALRAFGPAKLLETPEGWYERSRVYVFDNEYEGIHESNRYRVRVPRHCRRAECGASPLTSPPSTLFEFRPMASDYSY